MAADIAITPPVAMTGTGIAVFGVATGLLPLQVAAGAIGAYVGLSYVPPMSFLRRTSTVVWSAVVASWVAPLVTEPLANLARASLGKVGLVAGFSADHPGLAAITAFGIGLLANTVLMPWLVRGARKKVESLVPTEGEVHD